MSKKDKNSVYFVAPIVGKQKRGDAYKKIAHIIKERGYKVYDDVNNVTVEKARKMSEKEMEDYWKSVVDRIRKVDAFVAEVSEKSTSIGFEIGFAYGLNKPILLLRSDELKNPMGAPFRSLKSALKVRLYSQENLSTKINRFLNLVEKGKPIHKRKASLTDEQLKFVKYIQKKEKISAFEPALRHLLDSLIEQDTDF